jgi:hypothetical protein
VQVQLSEENSKKLNNYCYVSGIEVSAAIELAVDRFLSESINLSSALNSKGALDHLLKFMAEKNEKDLLSLGIRNFVNRHGVSCLAVSCGKKINSQEIWNGTKWSTCWRKALRNSELCIHKNTVVRIDGEQMKCVVFSKGDLNIAMGSKIQ